MIADPVPDHPLLAGRREIGQVAIGRLTAGIDRATRLLDNSGPGIPEPDRERVLDRVYRVAATETTGSGLSRIVLRQY